MMAGTTTEDPLRGMTANPVCFDFARLIDEIGLAVVFKGE